MERVIILILLTLATNCSKKMGPNNNLSKSLDSKGVRSKLMLDGRVWMTENLSIDISESYHSIIKIQF